MTIILDIDDDAWNRIADLQGLIEHAVSAAVATARPVRRHFEVCVVLSDDATVGELNARWRSKPTPTNVLSFPADVPPGWPDDANPPLGDIILAAGVVMREACEQGKTLENHLSHLVIHAMLHLFGYDHADDCSADTMEALEIAAMRSIGLPDPYHDKALSGGAH